MNYIFNYLTLIILLIYASVLSSQIKIEEKEIDKGIIHKIIINPDDTLLINILKIDIRSSDYTLHSIKAGNKLSAREKTSDMVRLYNDSSFNIIAAINADFFEADGEVVNNMISSGEFVKAVKFSDKKFIPFVATQFAVANDNQLLMEQFVFKGDLILPGGIVEEVNRINSNADSNSITIYNSYQGNVTPAVPVHWYNLEFLLEPIERNGDTLRFIVKDLNREGNSEIIKKELILAANNRYAHYLERELIEGDTVGLVTRLNPYYGEINTLAGGWPRIVYDGENVIRNEILVEGISKEFSETRHPRSGIGFSKDSTTIYFITVDGRQKTSRGMSLKEFADLMISEGIYHGLNLDGGGSTAMVIGDKIVNSPSDITGEREVANCLVLLKRKNK